MKSNDTTDSAGQHRHLTPYEEATGRLIALGRLDWKELLAALIRELTRLRQLQMSPQERFAIIYRLKPLIRQVTAKLPKSRPDDEGGASSASSLTIEQRLYALTAGNLQHLLRELDRSRHFGGASFHEERRWTQRFLIRALGHQIAYAARTGGKVPEGTWLDLHDLFLYLVTRAGLQLRHAGNSQPVDPDFQLEIAYKRLLLIGLHDATPGLPMIDRKRLRQLSRWALDSWLVAPEAMIGRGGLILVEVARDGPPSFSLPLLSEPFRGWVLNAAPPFYESILPAYRRRLAANGPP
jgi:hypothetical protein